MARATKILAIYQQLQNSTLDYGQIPSDRPRVPNLAKLSKTALGFPDNISETNSEDCLSVHTFRSQHRIRCSPVAASILRGRD
jgi:hypothetical protein